MKLTLKFKIPIYFYEFKFIIEMTTLMRENYIKYIWNEFNNRYYLKKLVSPMHHRDRK